MKTTLQQLIILLEGLDKEEMLKYEHGVLSTKGCVGDYGCCSNQIDVIGLIDDLKKIDEYLNKIVL